MQYKYLTSSWQGFLQQVVALVGKGYRQYSILKPKFRASISHWQKIDKIMLDIFSLENSNKNSRYQNKKKSNANFQYLRYQDVAVILKTDGAITESLKGQEFRHILDEPMILCFNTLSFKIGKSHKVDEFTVYLERETYRNIKAKLFEMIAHQRIDKLKYHFNILNNIPSYAGFTTQKRFLLNEVKKECKRHNIIFDKSVFFVGTRRKIYKVWDDEVIDDIEDKIEQDTVDENTEHTIENAKPINEYYERKQSTHLFTSLDDFKQAISSSVKHGYCEYFVVDPATKKTISKARWNKIDNKIIEKFSANKQRYKEYQNQKSKLVNFRYYRLKDIGIILKSNGKLPDGFVDAKFKDINKKGVKLQIEANKVLIIKISSNTIAVSINTIRQ